MSDPNIQQGEKGEEQQAEQQAEQQIEQQAEQQAVQQIEQQAEQQAEQNVAQDQNGQFNFQPYQLDEDEDNNETQTFYEQQSQNQQNENNEQVFQLEDDSDEVNFDNDNSLTQLEYQTTVHMMTYAQQIQVGPENKNNSMSYISEEIEGQSSQQSQKSGRDYDEKQTSFIQEQFEDQEYEQNILGQQEERQGELQIEEEKYSTEISQMQQQSSTASSPQDQNIDKRQSDSTQSSISNSDKQEKIDKEEESQQDSESNEQSSTTSNSNNENIICEDPLTTNNPVTQRSDISGYTASGYTDRGEKKGRTKKGSKSSSSSNSKKSRTETETVTTNIESTETNEEKEFVSYSTKHPGKLVVNVPISELQMKLSRYKLKTRHIGRKVDITAAILKLQDRINEVIDEYIEVFEVEMFDLTRIHSKELGGRAISFSSLGYIHHVYTLKYGEHSNLNEKDQAVVDQNFERTLKQNPWAIKEYRFLLQCITFISSMLIKWGLVSIEQYRYRLQRFAVNMKFLDMIVLNKDIITPETLWLTVAVYQPPLRNIVSDKILAYARKVQIDFMKMLGFLLRLNQRTDFDKIQSLQPVVAAKNKNLRRDKGWIPDREMKIQYQSLDITGFWSCAYFSSGFNARSFQLREYMITFERSYKRFESLVVQDFKKLAIK